MSSRKASTLNHRNFVAEDELNDFYSKKFKPYDLHNVEITNFDLIEEVNLTKKS